MPRDPIKYLIDAREACMAIMEFCEGRTYDEYRESKLLRSAVERQFEILGEALNRLDNVAPEFRAQYPDIGKIIGMRNRIIHGYDSVDDAIVWDAVKNYVPELLKWLRANLSER